MESLTHGLQIGPLLPDIPSDEWDASVQLAVDMELDNHSETGRSGSAQLLKLKRQDLEINVLVSAVDASGCTIGLLWAELHWQERRKCSLADVLLLKRVYVHQEYQGRHPSVMQLLWECMLGRMTEEGYQHVQLVTLQDVFCVRKAGPQWFHLFQQSAERCAEWTAEPPRKGPQHLGDPLPVIRRRSAYPRSITPFNPSERERMGIAHVNRLLTYPKKTGCNPDNVSLSFDVIVGRHRMSLPARGSLYPQTYWLQPVPSLGMFPFEVNSELLREVMKRFAARLHNNYNASQHPGDRCIGLLADTLLPSLNGYQSYDNTLSPVHNSFHQQRRTAVAWTQPQVTKLLADIPDISTILQYGLAALGLSQSYQGRCRMIHILAQDATSLARFKLHVDNTEGKGLSLGCTTVIIQLTEGSSYMRMWGCDSFEFRGIGAGVAFPGGALHESLPTDDSRVMFKLVFFLV